MMRAIVPPFVPRAVFNESATSGQKILTPQWSCYKRPAKIFPSRPRSTAPSRWLFYDHSAFQEFCQSVFIVAFEPSLAAFDKIRIQGELKQLLGKI